MYPKEWNEDKKKKKEFASEEFEPLSPRRYYHHVFWLEISKNWINRQKGLVFVNVQTKLNKVKPNRIKEKTKIF